MNFEVRVFVPKDILRQSIVQDNIALFMTKKTAPEVKALFRSTVFGWSNKPSFRQKLTKRANYMSETVWADGDTITPRGLTVAEQYYLVSSGVRPHTIPSSGTTYMRFPFQGRGKSYKASTSPGSIKSRKNYQLGHYTTFWKVNHPGLEARRFDETIGKQYDPIFRADMQTAISVAAKKSADLNNAASAMKNIK